MLPLSLSEDHEPISGFGNQQSGPKSSKHASLPKQAFFFPCRREPIAETSCFFAAVGKKRNLGGGGNGHWLSKHKTARRRKYLPANRHKQPGRVPFFFFFLLSLPGAEEQLTHHDVPPRKRKDGVECTKRAAKYGRKIFCWRGENLGWEEIWWAVATLENI